ncbi:MAG: two-component sensor histidine kinase [Planctomycetota bacterium]|nr:MAG: two-component sensor histidine kinase [Planctomycetota bacterium]
MTTETGLLAAALAAAALFGLVQTRRRRAAAAAAAREARQRRAHLAAADHLAAGVVLLDGRGRVRYANPAAVALLEASPPSPAAPPALAAWLPPPVAAALRPGDPEETFRKALEIPLAGGARVLELTGGPAGDRWRFLLLRDLRGAAAVDARRRDFVANASHELQTPIAALIGLLDLLEGAEGDEAADLLARAQANAQALASLTRDLLGLARAQDPTWRPAPEPLDGAAVAAAVAERLADKAAAKGLRLERELPADGLPMVADRTSLETVLANLLDNAVSYTEVGRVVLRGRTEAAAEVVFEIEDTGPGIEPEILPRIFERFFRGDPARSRAAGGTGLGLAIVRNLVGRMGGRISVRSRPGEGALFRVELPVSAAKPLPGAGQASFS